MSVETVSGDTRITAIRRRMRERCGIKITRADVVRSALYDDGALRQVYSTAPVISALPRNLQRSQTALPF